MKLIRRSFFKNPENDKKWFENWVGKLEKQNEKQYARLGVTTSLGYTHIWGLNPERAELPALVIFPGARTSSLFWDFDNGLKPLEENFRIYLVETNGLPNLSDGDTPDIKTLDYGHWATEVLRKLKIEKAFIAGASFGGLICLKLCLVEPALVEAVLLLNPGCLQPFNLSAKNLYYNLLPILFPTLKNVEKFLNKAVLNAPFHTLSAHSTQMLAEYELFALTRYHDETQKPYYMKDELSEVKSETYLIVGDRDILFPYQQSIQNARTRLSSLKEVKILPNVGHGIETAPGAIVQILRMAQVKR